MTDERLTEELARQVMNWKPAPGRFIKSGRAWIPRWRFSPLARIEDAFLLLDRAATEYRLTARRGETFMAEVRVGGRTGRGKGASKARAITRALASALGFEVDSPEQVS